MKISASRFTCHSSESSKRHSTVEKWDQLTTFTFRTLMKYESSLYSSWWVCFFSDYHVKIFQETLKIRTTMKLLKWRKVSVFRSHTETSDIKPIQRRKSSHHHRKKTWERANGRDKCLFFSVLYFAYICETLRSEREVVYGLRFEMNEKKNISKVVETIEMGETVERIVRCGGAKKINWNSITLRLFYIYEEFWNVLLCFYILCSN